jgi:hypothetical protein
MADPQDGYLCLRRLGCTPASVHRDGPFCFIVDGCGSVAELCVNIILQRSQADGNQALRSPDPQQSNCCDC